MSLFLGCIADDFTGASDLALTLTEHGMASGQVLGSSAKLNSIETEAIVVSLKTRTSSVKEAVNQSKQAAHWLLKQGARQLFFKYCSTFDSTADGNIGPVAECLLELVDEDITIVCPAFPDTGRTVRDGHLYVDGVLLADSSMRDHPLTPMRESDLVHMMDEQTSPGSSGLIELATVRSGFRQIRKKVEALRSHGHRFAIADAESNSDLMQLGLACRDMGLVTGASGMAMGLVPGSESSNSLMKVASEPIPKLPGHPLVISGSCSVATRKQVDVMKSAHASIEVNPFELSSGSQNIQTINDMVSGALKQGPVLVHSATDPVQVVEAQNQLGREATAELIEATLAGVAVEQAAGGCSKFITAGGETSGAVATALGVQSMKTGPRIDAGVPWMIRSDGPPQVLAFKSGNFGSERFFLDAIRILP